jgi:hypothetical protein
MSYLDTLRMASTDKSRPTNVLSSHLARAMPSATFKPNSAQALKASTVMVSQFTLSREPF